MHFQLKLFYLLSTLVPSRLPWWLRSKESCQCRRPKFNLWVRNLPWRRTWQKSHGREWRATVPRAVKESDITATKQNSSGRGAQFLIGYPTVFPFWCLSDFFSDLLSSLYCPLKIQWKLGSILFNFHGFVFFFLCPYFHFFYFS